MGEGSMFRLTLKSVKVLRMTCYVEFYESNRIFELRRKSACKSIVWVFGDVFRGQQMS